MVKKQPKKMLIFNILQILKKYSDEDHRLTQHDIIEYLKKDYDMVVDRKSVYRNLNDLIEEGIEIEYTEKDRGKGKDANTILTDFYLIRDFEDSELRLLIDGLLFSKYVPYSQCKELIEKLGGLSNEYFNARVKYIKTLPVNAPKNKELFYSIDIIDEAIASGKKIKFNYITYDIDKKEKLRVDGEGKPRYYVGTPIQMVATNGRYYLICNIDGHDDIANYRVDRIKNIELSDDTSLTKNEIKEIIKSFNLPKHMMEHIYMFSGEGVKTTFEFDEMFINDIFDWFGTDVVLKKCKGNKILCTVSANQRAMKYWALQYADYVRVIEPKCLVKDIQKSLRETMKKYRKS